MHRTLMCCRTLLSKMLHWTQRCNAMLIEYCIDLHIVKDIKHDVSLTDAESVSSGRHPQFDLL